MRRRLELGFVLLLAVFVTPAAGQSAAAGPEEKTVAVFGQTIHYWDVGSGPVLVLVHGLGSGKAEDWRYAIGPLSQKYRVLAMDQIGFGHSDKPLLDYRIQTYVDFLNEFLHRLKVDKASLAGESLGGWISAMYVLESSVDAHMVPVEKLVLVDAAGLKQDKPIPDLNPSTLAGTRALMEVVFHDTSWLSDDMVRKIFADKVAKNDGYTIRSLLSNPALGAERLDDRLGNIHVPTLVVWGKQDALLPITSGQRYAAGIAGAKWVSFDNCGHVPPVEKTAEFVSVVTGFLDGAATPVTH
jgi:pimeloyl-ACP methyl ester carboxylesterase